MVTFHSYVSLPEGIFERKLSEHVMGSHCQYGLLVDHLTYFYGNTSFNGKSHTECQSRIKNSVGSLAVGLPSSITMVEGDCMVFLLYHPQNHPVFNPTAIKSWTYGGYIL